MKAPASVAASAAALALRAELSEGMRPIAMLSLGDRSVDIRAGHDSLWAIIRRGNGHKIGGIALRLAHCWGGCARIRRARKPKGALLALIVESAIGSQRVVLRSDRDALETVRVTTELTPSQPLLIPFFPRDLYPLGAGDDPLRAERPSCRSRTT